MSTIRNAARLGIRTLAAGALVLASVVSSSATTVNFDSIATPNCGSASTDAIPPGYAGFTWDANLKVECNADYMGASGYANSYGSPSGSNAIYNAFGEHQVVITRATEFTFDGAMFSGWTHDDLVDISGLFTAPTVTVHGWLGGSEIWTLGQTLAGVDGSAALGYLLMPGHAGAIDSLVLTTAIIQGTDANAWLMDDLQYTDLGTRPGTGGPGNSAVPEPASMILLGSGIAGLVARRRRKGEAVRDRV